MSTIQYVYNVTLPDGSNQKRIKFPSTFNQQLLVGDIPSDVKFIEFGRDFNRELRPGVIPSGVHTLIFGTNFNIELDPGSIPESVVDLIFGVYFNQSLDLNIIPASVRNIVFSRIYSFQTIYLSHKLDTILCMYYDSGVALPDRFVNLTKKFVAHRIAKSCWPKKSEFYKIDTKFKFKSANPLSEIPWENLICINHQIEPPMQTVSKIDIENNFRVEPMQTVSKIDIENYFRVERTQLQDEITQLKAQLQSIQNENIILRNKMDVFENFKKSVHSFLF